MNRTTFHPGNFSPTEIVPSEIDSQGQEIRGIVQDESARQLSKILVPGSAGLFSTAPDLLKFLTMLLNKGQFNGRRYLEEKTIDLIFENQLLSHESAALGWELNQDRFMGKSHSSKTIGKTGFTGCLVVCDLEKQTAAVILSNRTYPKRTDNVNQLNQFRAAVCGLIFS
jgi:CubicO group peptidase (beta-lactamase class C family)